MTGFLETLTGYSQFLMYCRSDKPKRLCPTKVEKVTEAT